MSKVNLMNCALEISIPPNDRNESNHSTCRHCATDLQGKWSHHESLHTASTELYWAVNPFFDPFLFIMAFFSVLTEIPPSILHIPSLSPKQREAAARSSPCAVPFRRQHPLKSTTKIKADKRVLHIDGVLGDCSVNFCTWVFRHQRGISLTATWSEEQSSTFLAHSALVEMILNYKWFRSTTQLSFKKISLSRGGIIKRICMATTT